MKPTISVIICTHNPRSNYINRVLEALKSQTFPLEKWELLLIDNASHKLLSSEIDLSWHPNARHIREEKIGLTNARLRGFQEANAEIFVFADDDNVLDPDYLQNVVDILQQYLDLGAIGGKSIPEFEVTPEPWFSEVNVSLGCRDLGDEIQIDFWNKTSTEITPETRQYPKFSPIGSGLVLRREAAEKYTQYVTNNRHRLALGRTGKQLTSGEDNDIILTLLEAGWAIGYFPQLKLTHLISATRLTKNYLARLNRALLRSWVQVLDIHGIRPWKKIPQWTVFPRKFRAFFNYKPWTNPVSYIRWQGACGLFEGRAKLL